MGCHFYDSRGGGCDKLGVAQLGVAGCFLTCWCVAGRVKEAGVSAGGVT